MGIKATLPIEGAAATVRSYWRVRVASLAASFVLCGLACGADIPAELVGVWASAGTEFEGERLIGGEALFLTRAGRAALVGAPLPVRRCAEGSFCAPIIGLAGLASFDAATGRLSIAVQDGPQSRALEATFDAGAATLVLQTGPGKAIRFTRRAHVVPQALEAELHGNP